MRLGNYFILWAPPKFNPFL